MATIVLPGGIGSETSYWSPYMSNLLREVVADWIALADGGLVEPLSDEHLRVAKELVS